MLVLFLRLEGGSKDALNNLGDSHRRQRGSDGFYI